MKKISRVLSVLLCLIIAFSVFSYAVFADDEPARCSECGEVYSVTPVRATCINDGYTLYVCTHCGHTEQRDPTPATGHTYGEWTRVQEATCTQEGVDVRVCINCGSEDSRTFSVLPHVDDDGNGACDRCGAKMEVKYIFSPFEWLKSFIQFIRELIQGIFA